jgi:hypothetical protein
MQRRRRFRWARQQQQQPNWWARRRRLSRWARSRRSCTIRVPRRWTRVTGTGGAASRRETRVTGKAGVASRRETSSSAAVSRGCSSYTVALGCWRCDGMAGLCTPSSACAQTGWWIQRCRQMSASASASVQMAPFRPRRAWLRWPQRVRCSSPAGCRRPQPWVMTPDAAQCLTQMDFKRGMADRSS